MTCGALAKAAVLAGGGNELLQLQRYLNHPANCTPRPPRAPPGVVRALCPDAAVHTHSQNTSTTTLMYPGLDVISFSPQNGSRKECEVGCKPGAQTIKGKINL